MDLCNITEMAKDQQDKIIKANIDIHMSNIYGMLNLNKDHIKNLAERGITQCSIRRVPYMEPCFKADALNISYNNQHNYVDTAHNDFLSLIRQEYLNHKLDDDLFLKPLKHIAATDFTKNITKLNINNHIQSLFGPNCRFQQRDCEDRNYNILDWSPMTFREKFWSFFGY
jgi:hypothetical protein